MKVILLLLHIPIVQSLWPDSFINLSCENVYCLYRDRGTKHKKKGRMNFTQNEGSQMKIACVPMLCNRIPTDTFQNN